MMFPPFWSAVTRPRWVFAAMALAMSITLRAIFSLAASIILPSRLAAPLPCASAARSSSMMRWALVTFGSGGLKTSFGEGHLAGVGSPICLRSRGPRPGARRPL